MELVFIECMSGISKKDNPYHLLKLADPVTFENHVISYDPKKVNPENFYRGDKVLVSGELRTPFQNTMFVCTSLKDVG